MNDLGDPASFSRVCHLRDGSEVLMRAVRPDDLDKVVDAFHALEPESIYTRFHWPKRELSAGDISRFKVDRLRALDHAGADAASRRQGADHRWRQLFFRPHA